MRVRVNSDTLRIDSYTSRGYKLSGSLLSFTLIIELINVLRVTLHESKHHEGAYGANNPAYDNSGLSDLGHRASCPQGSASDSGPGLVLDRSGLAKVIDRMRIRVPVSWLCLSRWKNQKSCILDRLLVKTRMASPSQGRGRPRNSGDGHEPDYGQKEFFAAMTHMANTIQEGMAAANAAHANVVVGGEGNGPVDTRSMTLASFLKINPPTFQGTSNPSEANDWFLSMERAC
ncbi:hypothetical protein PIB30_055269 [Stylosanthes scabra]|uniref:Uncharacterized protein n=1 Tax=Stylosanthes scabra TaxID=79078 RepID=A0ABU6RJC0_9FABA|nr:hypothetical protein [Stylosanthes scabra]